MKTISKFNIRLDYEASLSVGKSELIYIQFPDFPAEETPGCIKKTIELKSLVNYEGKTVNLDFDKDNNLIGIEIY
jgi:hypothetical protein